MACTLAVTPSPAMAADRNRPSFLGKSLYTGEFHAHTSVSDGVQLPPNAYEHVRDETDADFFAVTEHDVMWDIRNGEDFVENWRDADSAEWRSLHESAAKFNAAQDDLVAVPAVENTWYDGTGHINVFNTDWHVTARATEKGSVDGSGNAVLAFGGDNKLMGAILPGRTTTLDVDLRLTDPDAGDSFTSARLVTNNGAVAHDFGKINGNDLSLTAKLNVKDGDYYYVRAEQADGNFLVSAPIWIGETTRGANYAPQITVPAPCRPRRRTGRASACPR
ncbi:hypothetical protein [Streptosporangium subroseum]|uniref:hypothetical protein n=1 Tax=Streptosporangium subroseum TaxID=106412 RepID=UPI000B76E0CC|nr:hypothetical protein [Streptosporangium subroseum]